MAVCVTLWPDGGVCDAMAYDGVPPSCLPIPCPLLMPGHQITVPSSAVSGPLHCPSCHIITHEEAYAKAASSVKPYRRYMEPVHVLFLADMLLLEIQLYNLYYFRFRNYTSSADVFYNFVRFTVCLKCILYSGFTFFLLISVHMLITAYIIGLAAYVSFFNHNG